MSIVPHLERNLAQAKQLGQVDRAKKLKDRIAAETAPPKPKKKKPAAKTTADKKKGGDS